MRSWLLPATGATVLIWWLMPTPRSPDDPSTAAARASIVRAAQKNGVPSDVALKFAWLESRFNPRATGDVNWALWNDGARYKKYVLENAKFARNPYRNMPGLWHSYGLFQLLAPHFCGAIEDPRVLYDPDVNADRGTKYLATCLAKAKGDPRLARLYYAGATNLDDGVKQQLLAKFDKTDGLFLA